MTVTSSSKTFGSRATGLLPAVDFGSGGGCLACDSAGAGISATFASGTSAGIVFTLGTALSGTGGASGFWRVERATDGDGPLVAFVELVPLAAGVNLLLVAVLGSLGVSDAVGLDATRDGVLVSALDLGRTGDGFGAGAYFDS